MQVLLFEWLTGGGLWVDQLLPDLACSVQRQGREMLAALAEDFQAAGVEVVVPIDERLTQWMPRFHPDIAVVPFRAGDEIMQQLAVLSPASDYIMLIAPEYDSRLLNCVKSLDRVREKLISPNARFVEMTSCKMSTIEHLQSERFDAVPFGMRLSTFIDEDWRQRLRLPAVLKPTDGVGSEDVRLIGDWNDLDVPRAKPTNQYRIESFVSGTPVGVSILCGDQNQILAPMRQVFDREPFGSFVRAQYTLTPEINDRAIQLAMEAVEALPETRGYIGIDMIISDTDVQFDCLIEVNPRLTMSYLKLREIYLENLAMLILHTAISSSESPAQPVVNQRSIFRPPIL